MFKPCPLIDNRICPFASESTYNPKDRTFGGQKALFCGIARSVDNRIQGMPKCWKFMTQHERKKHVEASSWMQYK